MPPQKSYLKLNMGAGFKDSSMAITVLGRDKCGKVQGLSFEWSSSPLAMEAKVKAIFNACVIANEKPFLKIIIESDCKSIMDVVLGFSSCPWCISTIVKDIKLFLEDCPHVSLAWISIANMATHKSAH